MSDPIKVCTQHRPVNVPSGQGYDIIRCGECDSVLGLHSPAGQPAPPDDALYEALADEAERGYDVSHVVTCPAGGVVLPTEGLTDCGNDRIICPSCGQRTRVNRAGAIVGHAAPVTP
jgi:hypothetical protein